MSDDLTYRGDADPRPGSDGGNPSLSIILRAIQGALKQGRCNGEFQVGHVLDTGSSMQILSRIVDLTRPLEEQMREAIAVATEFNDATLTHVRAFRTFQKYEVHGFSKKTNTPIESMVFPQSPQNDADFAGMTITPTDKGVLMIMQESMLAHANHGYRARADEVDRMERQLKVSEERAEKLAARLERFEDKRAEIVEKYEELLQKQHERDREKAAGEATAQQAQKLMTAAMFLGKVACDRWGIEIPQGAFEALMMSGESGDKDNPVVQLKTKLVLEKMTKLLQSLTAEQQLTIIGCLNEQQQAAFAEGFQMMLAAAKPAAPATPTNGAVKSVTMTTPVPVAADKRPGGIF